MSENKCFPPPQKIDAATLPLVPRNPSVSFLMHVFVKKERSCTRFSFRLLQLIPHLLRLSVISTAKSMREH